MLDQRDLAKFGGAAAGGHAALAERRVAHGRNRGARRGGVADMRHLDALHADIQEPQDEGRIEPRRAHDRRDPDALGCHYGELHVVQVEAGVLHIDERRIEAREPDQLDDLGVGDAANMSSQGEAALAQDALDPVLSHVLSPVACRRR